MQTDDLSIVMLHTQLLSTSMIIIEPENQSFVVKYTLRVSRVYRTSSFFKAGKPGSKHLGPINLVSLDNIIHTPFEELDKAFKHPVY